MSFNPSKHFPYAYQAIEHIEEHNCAKGCIYGTGYPYTTDNPEEPGGSCETIVSVMLETDIEELEPKGNWVKCNRRVSPNTMIV